MAKIRKLLDNHNLEGYTIDLYKAKQGNVINFYGHIARSGPNNHGFHGPVILDIHDVHLNHPIYMQTTYDQSVQPNVIRVSIVEDKLYLFVNGDVGAGTKRYFNETFISQRNEEES